MQSSNTLAPVKWNDVTRKVPTTITFKTITSHPRFQTTGRGN